MKRNKYKYTIIPSSQEYKSAPSLDQKVTVSLQEKQQQITEYDRNNTISLADVFDSERQASTIFRPTFKIDYIYANTLTGTGTIFDQEILEGDVIILSSGEEYQVKKIVSPTELKVTANTLTSNVTANTVTKTGITDIWNDRFLKAYATAKIKYQWGSNLSKFAGIQMPGGVTFDGPRIMQEALEEINKMEEDMYQMGSLPSEIFTG